MAFDIDTITNSSIGISLLSTIGKGIPEPVGVRLADLVAGLIASRRNSRLVCAVRSNQRVVLGQDCERVNLDRAVRETLRNSARSVFDLYHYIDNLQAIGKRITMDPAVEQMITRSEFEARGLMVVGLHIANFDLILRWLCHQGIRLLVLTVSDPRGGRRAEFVMRRNMGMNLVPATVAGLRKTVRHLQQGGSVLTGIDRPIASPRLLPSFFGRPAALPVHHVYLAMKAGVPVTVVAAMRVSDGRYHVMASDTIEMEGSHDHAAETLRNAERVLRAAEGMIRRAPQQWSVPVPVWPSALGLVPQ
jgi:lauroyl/myristoyl acyltransferase